MHRPVQLYARVDNPSSDLMQRRVDTPSPSLSKDLSPNVAPGKQKLTTVMIMVLPLIFQAAIAIAIACIMIFPLDQSQFFLERYPTVTLADGTSIQLDGYHLLQSDITTLLSVSLVILRWVAAAWAGPLCWRVICLLGESHGVQRRDIRWASNRMVLPPSTYFRNPLAFVLGIILLVSAVPQAFSPVLTGAIRWEPITLNLDPIPGHSQPIVNISEQHFFDSEYSGSNVPMIIARDYVTTWGNSSETNVSRRLIPAIEGLGINSTLANITLPYLHTSVEWYKTLPSEVKRRINETMYVDGILAENATQLQNTHGSIWLTTDQVDFWWTRSWYLVLRAREGACSLQYYPYSPHMEDFPGYCHAVARVWFNATSGLCVNCRVVSQSVVQNDTELQLAQHDPTGKSYRVANMLAARIPNMTVLTTLLPAVEADRTRYVQMFLFRAYCSLWATTTELASQGVGAIAHRQSAYSPPLPSLKARVDSARVFAWLGVQLLATCAGVVFLYLQSKSKHPLIEDASMIAFDMDTSDAPKPSAHDKSEPTTLLIFESDGESWKVVVNSSLDPSTGTSKPSISVF
ncbi:unnamed protein product [Rhizoctonia solani]|uniref:Transmembrane protein n=1 Tax=Rhizoctonia solani TaxID=456999 RepID=A0A8H3DTU1_9AGAM|nr:unnamed protein product [Rhizoctonia solani]